MVPLLDTAGELAVANGLTALITSGSLDTFVVAWLTADCWSATVPLRAWNTIWPAYPPCWENWLFSVSTPWADELPGTVKLLTYSPPNACRAPSSPPSTITQPTMTIQCRRAASRPSRSNAAFILAPPP